MQAYIEANLPDGCIQRSPLPAAAPILVAKQNDGGLKLRVDYRALNVAMVMHWYPLPSISEMLDHVGAARILTQLDLHIAYNLIQMKECNQAKMAFHTRYGQFKYWVMPFGLTHAPAGFQSYIDDCLRPYFDV